MSLRGSVTRQPGLTRETVHSDMLVLSWPFFACQTATPEGTVAEAVLPEAGCVLHEVRRGHADTEPWLERTSRWDEAARLVAFEEIELEDPGSVQVFGWTYETTDSWRRCRSTKIP